ncbi:MAG: tail fiber protein [Pseudomonadota bacterium]
MRFSKPFSVALALAASLGAAPATASEECMIGEVRLFAGTFAPRNWAFAHGQSLPVREYDAMFSVVGTTYGGNGRTSFQLPDLRDRAPIGAGGRFRLGRKDTIDVPEAEDNRGPEIDTLAMNYIICLEGIYPARE